MVNLTKYRSDLKSEYIRVGTNYYKFVFRLSLVGEECGMYLRPWNIRTMKADKINLDEVPKYDDFHHTSFPDYPNLFSLEGFVKARRKLEKKAKVQVYEWVGSEPDKNGKNNN